MKLDSIPSSSIELESKSVGARGRVLLTRKNNAFDFFHSNRCHKRMNKMRRDHITSPAALRKGSRGLSIEEIRVVANKGLRNAIMSVKATQLSIDFFDTAVMLRSINL